MSYMVSRKHKPGCRKAAWQLQYSLRSLKRRYRAVCLGCGATVPVTEEQSRAWNRFPCVKPAIQVGPFT